MEGAGCQGPGAGGALQNNKQSAIDNFGSPADLICKALPLAKL